MGFLWIGGGRRGGLGFCGFGFLEGGFCFFSFSGIAVSISLRCQTQSHAMKSFFHW